MSNKTVTFGGVFHFPAVPKTNKEDVKKAEAEGKTVSIKNRFNCGTLRNSIKMMGSNNNALIALIVRSKLRKRDDTPLSTTATPTTNNNTTSVTTNANHNNNIIQQTNNHLHLNNQTAVPAPQQPVETNTSVTQSSENLLPFLWVYQTNGNSTTASSQYTLYNNDQDTLVQNLQCEEPRECKGFRKNLKGKWKRLVKKKPSQEAYTIPPELRDQLKQIYVY